MSPLELPRRAQSFSVSSRLTTRRNSEGMSHDDETQFLNYILTKIANSQPEVQ